MNITQSVKAVKIHEGSRFNSNNHLFTKFFLFEHKVSEIQKDPTILLNEKKMNNGSSSHITQKKPNCIEIVAYSSHIDNSAVHDKNKIDDKNKMEASRLYLCSKKLLKLASLFEREMGKSNKNMSRVEGSRQAQISMIDYIFPRINVSEITEKKDVSLQVQWSPSALDRDKSVSYDGFKVLGQLPHIDHIT